MGYRLSLRTAVSLLACSIIISCSSNKPEQVDLKLSTLSIPVSTQFLTEYIRWTIYQDKFVGYNHANHSFDIFNLADSSVTGQILLNKEGPDSFNASDFNILHDTIYVLDRYDIWLLTMNGEIVHHVELDEDGDILKNRDIKTPVVYSNDRLPLPIDRHGNVFFTVFEHRKYDPCGWFQFNIGSQRYSEFKNTECLNYFAGKGILSNPDLTILESGGIIFSSRFSNSIFRKEQDVWSEISLQSSVNNRKAENVMNDDLTLVHKFYIKNRFYGNLAYLENRGFYARVVYETERESMFDKMGQYLCVFDSMGREVAKQRLDMDIFPFAMVWQDRLVFQTISKSEDAISFLIVEVL